MTAEEIYVTITDAKVRYFKNNKKEPDYVVMSQNLYFTLCRAYYHPDSAKESYFTKICEMSIKLISDSDFLMVGRNEILKLKGEKGEDDGN